MPERIYRYEVPIDGRPHVIELTPGKAAEWQPLKVAVCGEALEFWAVCGDAHAALSRRYQVVGTGHDLPEGAVWRGTAERTNSGLVWHLVELP